METSILLAKFWGALCVALGLIYLLRPVALKKTMEYAADEKYIFLAGFLSLLLGLASVVLHNVWAADWRLAATLFGWGAVLKGVLRLGFGSNSSVIVKAFGAPLLRWAPVPLLLFGLWLLYRACLG